MEEARKKLRMCLFCVVTTAIVVGLIYYFSTLRVEKQISDGVLVQRIERLDHETGSLY
jgi:hypothetical protein